MRKTKRCLYLPPSLIKKGRISLPGHRSRRQQRVLHPSTRKGQRAALVNYMCMHKHSLTHSERKNILVHVKVQAYALLSLSLYLSISLSLSLSHTHTHTLTHSLTHTHTHTHTLERPGSYGSAGTGKNSEKSVHSDFVDQI